MRKVEVSSPCVDLSWPHVKLVKLQFHNFINVADERVENAGQVGGVWQREIRRFEVSGAATFALKQVALTI